MAVSIGTTKIDYGLFGIPKEYTKSKWREIGPLHALGAKHAWTNGPTFVIR